MPASATPTMSGDTPITAANTPRPIAPSGNSAITSASTPIATISSDGSFAVPGALMIASQWNARPGSVATGVANAPSSRIPNDSSTSLSDSVNGSTGRSARIADCDARYGGAVDGPGRLRPIASSIGELGS